MPSPEPLQAALDEWLHGGETRPAPTLRRGKFDLARAYGLVGDWRQAAELLDAATREPGDDPAGTELRRWRARALLADGDLVGAARALLAWPLAKTWDDAIEVLARALLAAVTADDAARLATWLETSIVDGAAEPAAAQTRARILDAALRLLAGDADTAVEAFAAAAKADLTTARRTWQALAEAPPIAAALQPSTGKEAAALTLSARIAFSLGYADEANELVARVLDGRLTGEDYPETEAYLLRGHDSARPPSARAKDLLEAARRLGWRQDRPNLLRSLQVAAEAVELEPVLQEAYWLWSDNQRYAANRPDGTAGQADMLTALSIWDKGRRLGPAAEAWPRQVEAQICWELAQFNTPGSLTLAYRSLRAASECALADPVSPSAWALISDAAYLLNLWSTTVFTADLSVQLARDLPEQLPVALGEVIGICFQTAPGRVPEALDELERASGTTPWTARLRAIIDVRAGQHERAKTQLREQLAKVPNDAGTRYWYMRSLVLSGDDATAAILKETIQQTEDASRIYDAQVRAWALLWDGRAAEATNVISRLRQGSVERLLDLSVTAGLPMQAALLLGDDGEADKLAATLLPSLPLGALMDLDAELRWIEQQLDKRGDQPGRVCASRIRIAAERARSSAPHQGPQGLGSVLGELERAICDKAVPAQERRAVSMARLVISAHARGEPDVADWLTPLAVEFGGNLVPADRRDWEQWELFTEIIPQLRAQLRETIGLQPPGVRVRDSNDLSPLQYRLLLDEHPFAEGTVGQPGAVPESQAAETGQVDPALWRQAMDAVSERLSARPTMLCTPEAVGSLLTEWESGTEEQQNLARRLEANREACIRLWRDMYAATLAKGHLPPWDSGLREITEAALGLAAAVPATLLPATAGSQAADQPAVNKADEGGAGLDAEHEGEGE